MRLSQKAKKGMPQVRSILLSFVAIIAVGTLLLIMPFSSSTGEFTNPTDALFVSTSATCVTGLTVFDTFTHWSFFGQAVLLVLIQLGGLSLVTLVTFFTMTVHRRLGIRDLQLASEYISNGSLKDIPRLLRLIVGVTLVVECLGALVLSLRFIPQYGADGLWISVFLAVSAYCNAGFDILGRETPSGSLMNYNDDPLVMITIMALIVIGGIGFIVFNDLFFHRRGKPLLLHTRVVLIGTALLIGVGVLGFLAAEFNNPETLGPMPLGDKCCNAFFQSITCRTAGFNSISMDGMTPASKVLSCLLMFVGTASGSTGGGIKITTVAVLLMTVVSVSRGREDTVILGRRVSKQVVYKSLAIAVISMVLLLAAFLIVLSCEENASPLNTLFETVSAFSTTGLSCGMTPDLTMLSKIVLTFAMFAGRVGPVSLAIGLAARNENKNEVLPEGRIIVG